MYIGKLKNKKFMRIAILILMACQSFLIGIGIGQILTSDLRNGIFNVVFNSIFFALNVYNLILNERIEEKQKT